MRVDKDRPNEVKVAACSACKRRRTACSTGSRTQRVRIVDGTTRLVLVCADDDPTHAARGPPEPQQSQTVTHRNKRQATAQSSSAVSRGAQQMTLVPDTQEALAAGEDNEAELGREEGGDSGDGRDEDGEEEDEQDEENGDGDVAGSQSGAYADSEADDESCSAEESDQEDVQNVRGGRAQTHAAAIPPAAPQPPQPTRQQRAGSHTRPGTTSIQPATSQPASLAPRKRPAQSHDHRPAGQSKAPRATHRRTPSATTSSVVTTDIGAQAGPSAGHFPPPGGQHPPAAAGQGQAFALDAADEAVASAADEPVDYVYLQDLFTTLGQLTPVGFDTPGPFQSGMMEDAMALPDPSTSVPAIPAATASSSIGSTAPIGHGSAQPHTPISSANTAAASIFAGHSVWRNHRRQARRSSLDPTTVGPARTGTASVTPDKAGLADAVHAMITDALCRDSLDTEAKTQALQTKLALLEQELTAVKGDKVRLEQVRLLLSVLRHSANRRITE